MTIEKSFPLIEPNIQRIKINLILYWIKRKIGFMKKGGILKNPLTRNI
jgi:hypothetical protein